MNTKNIVPIVFSFDNNFFVAAMVTIYSMLKSANKETYYDIFIMTDLEKLLRENKEDLLNFEISFTARCRINFIDMKSLGENFSVNWDTRLTQSVYYRLFIQNYIFNYDKVIFSDVDIVILKDLYEIYSTELNENYLGAIKQTMVNGLSAREYKKYINKASSIKQGNYFNAGFLLMNLKMLRDGNYSEEFIRLAKVGFNNNDQDILNLVFEDKVIYIPIKYCYIPMDSYFIKEDRNKLLKLHSQNEIDEYFHDPAIIHYAVTKPWVIHSLEFVDDMEMRKYKVWWDTLYECMDFINKKAIFDLYQKMNNNILFIGIEYCKNQTVLNSAKRLISLTSKKLGIHPLLKFFKERLTRKVYP